jgi:beta-glucosidase
MALKHADVIAKLTLEEKVSLLSGKNFWETQEIKKVGIPSIFLSDGPNGLRKQAAAADQLGLNPSVPATCFPTSASSANSWDPSVLYQVGQAIGEEARDAKVSVLLGPGINMKRNPRCGRNFEYFSEDPYLAGKLAAGYIQGVQSNGIYSCVKHFACNDQETRRLASDSIVDERALREIYLTAFEMAIKEGKARFVMSAYNLLNGTYCNENDHLLQEILRKEWGFDGVVVTDWGGDNDRVKGLECGNELEMPSTCGETNLDVKAAVKNGTLKEAVIDEAIDRLIDASMASAKVVEAAPKTFDKVAHHALAQKVAEESIVLLKNKNGILPLKAGTKVALIGDFAKEPRYQGAGSSIVNPLKVDTILDSIKDYPLTSVGYAQGFKRYGKNSNHLLKEAVNLADKADVLLVFIGLDEFSEAEGLDRKHLRLPDNQRELVSALYHTGKPIICVLSCGAPVELPLMDRVNALVHGYLGGEAGARAMLNVLTGKVNPSGKLAETYPYGYPDVPSADHFGRRDPQVQYRESLFIGYRYFETAGIDVRFPFGFGLSYTTFDYSNLAVTPSGVTFTIKNTGKVAGKEIAQLYIGKTDSFVPRAVRELKGFCKVMLEPGESKTVTIPFDDKSFRYFNVKSNRFEIEGGNYRLEIGASSLDIRLSGTISQEGTTAPQPYEIPAIPHYMSGKVREISDEEFEKILGHAIPEDRRVYIKRNRILVDCGTAVCDLKYSPGWFGRFFERAIRHIIHFLRRIGHRADANTLLMGIYENPLRNMSRMSGGAICWKQLDGLILMCNGHFFKGLNHFLHQGYIFRKQRKAEAKLLKKQNQAKA